jgi:transposase
VGNHQIIDILPTRSYVDVAGFIGQQPDAWRHHITYGALDMSATYAAVYSVMLPRAAQVVDRFHVIALANRCLDSVRRRVQNEQLGHRGRRDDPLYRVRRALLVGEEKLSEEQATRLNSLLALGDPHAEVALAYRMKERLRDFYRCWDPEQARAMLDDLQTHCLKRAMPPEIRKLGRTLKEWFVKICNYHLARITNAPTEALNNLIKRIKRVGFGFRNFKNYRIRIFSRTYVDLALDTSWWTPLGPPPHRRDTDAGHVATWVLVSRNLVVSTLGVDCPEPYRFIEVAIGPT